MSHVRDPSHARYAPYVRDTSYVLVHHTSIRHTSYVTITRLYTIPSGDLHFYSPLPLFLFPVICVALYLAILQEVYPIMCKNEMSENLSCEKRKNEA